MSEMVERVARAICDNPNKCEFPKCHGVCARMWQVRVETMARAAIEAMREPTKEMLLELRESIARNCIDTNAGGESGPVPGLEDGAELDAYYAAIDAALTPPKDS